MLLRKFAALPREQRQLLARALFWMGVVRVGLRVVTFNQLRQWIGRMRARARHPVCPSSRPSIDQIRWAVQVSSHYLPGSVTCLPRALTAEMLLRCYGYPCELRIGVTSPAQAGFQAHAWVESQGEIVVGDLPDLERFAPLVRLS